MKRYRFFFQSVLAIVIAVNIVNATNFTKVMAQDAAVLFTTGFEHGLSDGFIRRSDCEKLTVTNEAAHSGKNALLITNRSQAWHGVDLFVENIVELNRMYTIAVWVRQKTQGEGFFVLQGQYLPDATGEWVHRDICAQQVTAADGWVRLTGQFTFTVPSEYMIFNVHNGTADAEFYIDDVTLEPWQRPSTPGTLTYGFEESDAQGISGPIGMTVTDKEAHTGKKSLLLKNNKNKTDWINADVQLNNAVTPNYEYEVAVWVKSNMPEVNRFTVSVIFNTDDTVYDSNIIINQIYINRNDGWSRLIGRFTAVNSLKDVWLTIVPDEPGIEFYIDDISVKPTQSVDLLDNIARSAKLPSLREIYKDYFLIGSSFGNLNYEMFDEANTAFHEQHFNLLHNGNLSMGSVTKVKGEYRFDLADITADIIQQNGSFMQAGALIYDQADVSWLNYTTDGRLLTRSEALANMTACINAVVGHYNGKVYAWQVVNEAFAPWEENFKESTKRNWRNGIKTDVPSYMSFANGADAKKGESGADYIEAAFRITRAADPQAKLFYNADISEDTAHIAAVASMVKEINDRWLSEGHDRLLIDGVGLQGIFGLETDPVDVETNIKTLIDIGVEINITEFHINLFGSNGSNRNEYQQLKPTQALYNEQAKLYAKCMILFKKYASHISEVIFCRIDDASNWLRYNFPCPFDDHFNPKPAYFAIADPEGYLSGKYKTVEQREMWIKSKNK